MSAAAVAAPTARQVAVGVQDCEIHQLPKIVDHRGNLTFVEGERHVPFQVRRVFYVYDIPSGEQRGAHAHRRLHQMIVCLAGSMDVTLNDGTETRIVRLDRPWHGLHITPMIWASEGNFSPGTVYLVLASDPYDESDYLRDYDTYVAATKLLT
jgi:hypothetical protein